MVCRVGPRRDGDTQTPQVTLTESHGVSRICSLDRTEVSYLGPPCSRPQTQSYPPPPEARTWL